MELQLALLVLGVVVVALVFALSRYAHRLEPYRQQLRMLIKRYGPSERTKPGRRSRRDPLLDQAEQASEPAQETLFGEGDEPTPHHQAVSPVDPSAGDSATETELMAAASSEETGEETITSLKQDDHEIVKPSGPFTSLRQIDYWIKLTLSAPVTRAEILANLKQWDQISFPVQLHGLTQEEPHWVDLSDTQGEGTFTDVVASYQLLYQGNPASIEELDAFDAQVSALGKQLDAEKLMMATPEQARDQSLKLARFFSESCEPLEVSVCAPRGQAFMGKLVETSAKQQGLDFIAGEYVRQKRMASQNVILYRVINSDTGQFDENMSADAGIRCVTFTMLPALSQTPGRDAKEMLDAVKAFASRVKGEIRVPGEKEFHQDLLLKLRNRVSKLERDTLAAGLEPGGLEICRIFS